MSSLLARDIKCDMASNIHTLTIKTPHHLTIGAHGMVRLHVIRMVEGEGVTSRVVNMGVRLSKIIILRAVASGERDPPFVLTLAHSTA